MSGRGHAEAGGKDSIAGREGKGREGKEGKYSIGSICRLTLRDL
jgi:hypothetical protein